MIGFRDYFKLGFKEKELDVTKLKIFQAGRRENLDISSTPSCIGERGSHSKYMLPPSLCVDP